MTALAIGRNSCIMSAQWILGNVSADVSEFEVVACVEHAAVCVAASLDQVVLGFLSCRDEHLGAVKVLCKKGLGDLGAEVAEINAECVAAGSFDVRKSLNHMDLALDNADGTFIDIRLIIFCLISLYESFSAVYGKAFRETVAADSDDAELHFGNVGEHVLTSSEYMW